MAKRTFDVIVAALALVLLSPVMLAIALTIRWTSPGPVLFRQTRMGRGLKPFEILKFRTMVVDAEKLGLPLTAGADLRITPLGRFLLLFQIDELPQLMNVLRGEMSLVGPRPTLMGQIAGELAALSLYDRPLGPDPVDCHHERGVGHSVGGNGMPPHWHGVEVEGVGVYPNSRGVHDDLALFESQDGGLQFARVRSLGLDTHSHGGGGYQPLATLPNRMAIYAKP